MLLHFKLYKSIFHLFYNVISVETKISNDVNVLKRCNSDNNKIKSLGTNLLSHKVYEIV